MLLGALLGRAPGGGTGFAVLTREALAPVRALHDRMPVILAPALLEAWLTGPPPRLPLPTGGDLVGQPVSPRVNSVDNDDPGCLAPDEPAQRRLFS
jgi:putative SOS response-associated peptidase YedK